MENVDSVDSLDQMSQASSYSVDSLYQMSQASSYSAIEICVYMMDNKGLTLVLDEGRSTTSDFILDVILEELSIPYRYKPCFGIWLSSPLLHLQV